MSKFDEWQVQRPASLLTRNGLRASIDADGYVYVSARYFCADDALALAEWIQDVFEEE